MCTIGVISYTSFVKSISKPITRRVYITTIY